MVHCCVESSATKIHERRSVRHQDHCRRGVESSREGQAGTTVCVSVQSSVSTIFVDEYTSLPSWSRLSIASSLRALYRVIPRTQYVVGQPEEVDVGVCETVVIGHVEQIACRVCTRPEPHTAAFLRPIVPRRVCIQRALTMWLGWLGCRGLRGRRRLGHRWRKGN